MSRTSPNAAPVIGAFDVRRGIQFRIERFLRLHKDPASCSLPTHQKSDTSKLAVLRLHLEALRALLGSCDNRVVDRMKSKRHFGRRVAAAGLLAIAPLSTGHAQAPADMVAAVADHPDYGVAHFYKARSYQPLWIVDGRLSSGASELLAILERAGADEVAMEVEATGKVVDAARLVGPASSAANARAELMLTDAWVRYVQALAPQDDGGVTYIDAALAPRTRFPAEILAEAASASSLTSHLKAVAKRNPVYQGLLRQLVKWREQSMDRRASPGSADVQDVERRLLLNLERARALPVGSAGKYIVVDAANARLWLFDDGEVRDTMKIVVGKAEEQTPLAAGLIRSMVLKPYWNVPPDLIRDRIAQRVLGEGVSYLRDRQYQVLSGWEDDAMVLNPGKINWQDVASGTIDARVRQLPGAGNAMGDMKFLFPNQFGVYLHDTPSKSLFDRDDRSLSSGCVRLEDAPRLAAWLFGEQPPSGSGEAEEVIPLPVPVPVYLTYFTVRWDSSALELARDVYGRDDLPEVGSQLASTSVAGPAGS